MYKRILVAIDGTHCAEAALKEAIRLATALDGHLRIVHVVDETSLVMYTGSYAGAEDIWKAAKLAGIGILENGLAMCSMSGMSADSKLLEIRTPGIRVSEEIAEHARSWPADLIVAGTHGRHGISRILLGSVAEGVVRVTTKPVLLVRSAAGPT